MLKKEVEQNTKPFMSKRANANEEAKAIQSTFDLLNKPNA